MEKIEDFSKSELLLLALGMALMVFQLISGFYNPINTLQTDQHLFAAVHEKTNAYFYLTSIGNILADDYGVKILLLLGIVGTFLALSTSKISQNYNFLVSLFGWSFVLAVFGGDFSVLSVLALTPLVYLSLNALGNFNFSHSCLIFLVIISAWLCVYNLALPVYLLALMIFLLSKCNLDNSNESEKICLSVNARIFLASLTVLLFFLNSISPALPWPDYPAGVRLTNITDGPGWYARPLIGPDTPVPVLDRHSLKISYDYLILPLAAALFLISLKFRKSPSILICLSVLFICCFCDLKLSESTAQISPIQAASRMLPGLIQSPLTLILLGGLLLSCSILLAICFKIPGVILILVSFITLIFSGINQQPALLSAVHKQYAASPSSLAARSFPALSLLSARMDLRKSRPGQINPELRSSNPQTNSASLLVDKDPASRWSSGQSKQQGEEWLELEFSSPNHALGLELDPGNFVTDFPRGISVKLGESCDPDKMSEVYRQPNWQGSPLFTQSGLPYFSAQSEVKIFFDTEKHFSCLRLEQLGKTDNYDWSIAELRLLQKKTDRN